MASEEFEGAVDEAKRMERKLSGYTPYEGEVDIEHTLDLEPREYVDLGYQDMLNLYERTQKIRSAAGLGILTKEAGAAAEASAAPQPTARSEEIESKLKEMTSETLEKAEEIGKKTIEFEKPQPEEKPPEAGMEIEFEHMPAEKAIEFEKEQEKPKVEEAKPEAEEKPVELEKPEEKEEIRPIQPEIEGKREKPEAARPEAKPQPAVMPHAAMPMPPARPGAPERKVVVAALPLSLRESPDEAAAKRFGQIEEQIRAALGGATDEVALKKKMLELTKELFKEKSTARREQLKLEITVLKNMLSAAPAKKRKKGPEAEEKEAHARVLDAIISSQQTELAQTKDSVTGSYAKQMASVRKRFQDDLSAAGEDIARKKQALETLVFSLTSLVEQLPGVIGKYEDFLTKKHAAEIEKLRGSLGGKEKDVEEKAGERLEQIRDGYKAEFATVKGIVAHDLDNMMEASGREVFGRAEGEKEDEESRARDVIIEINDMDEGTLLYYLHSKQPDYYKKYERKQISKAEAIFRAKAVMAKEKGLSDEMIKRHFAATEG